MSKSYSPTWRFLSVIVLRPLLHLLVKNKWAGQENIPRKGGVILAPNHLSYADWGTDSLFFYEAGRYPTYLIKSSMFEAKGIGPFLYKAGQLPVHRGRADAGLVLKAAEKAIAEGAAVVFYPEGTATRDPDLWPMVAKTGVARLALSTGAPVIPVAHWGTQSVLPYGSKKPRFFPRQTVRTVAGKPVDLSAWAGKYTSAKALRAATDAIMGEVAALLAELRQEEPPAVPYNPDAVLTNRGSHVSPPPAVTGGDPVPGPDPVLGPDPVSEADAGTDADTLSDALAGEAFADEAVADESEGSGQ